MEELTIVNILIAIIIYGIALKIKKEDLDAVIKSPRIILIAVFCQYFILPASAYIVLTAFNTHPLYSLGIIAMATIVLKQKKSFLAKLLLRRCHMSPQK